MKILEDGRINCRVKITGTYHGRPFEYIDPEGCYSQFIWPNGDPSSLWWSEGGMRCDCARSYLLPEEWGIELDCGEEIMIDSIEPIDYNGPVLHLNESQE